MARLGISLDLGADLEKLKKRDEAVHKKPHEPEKKPIEKTKPGVYVLPLFVILLLIGGIFTLTTLQRLDIVEKQVKDSFLTMLKNDVQKQVESDYAQASDEEKHKIFSRQYFDERNSVNFLKQVFKQSNALKKNYLDAQGRVYFFGRDAYTFLTDFESRFGESVFGFPSSTVVFYLPLILALLAGLSMFFMLWKTTNMYAGFLGAAVFLLHPLLMKTNSAALITYHSFLLPLVIILFSVFGLFLLGKRKGLAFLGFIPIAVVLYTRWSGSYTLNNPFNEIGYFFAFLVLNSFLILCYKMISENRLVLGYFLSFGVLTCILATLQRTYSPYFLAGASVLLGVGYFLIEDRLLEFGHQIILPARTEYWHFAYLSCLLLVLMLSLIPNIAEAKATTPGMNDALYDAALFLKQGTPKDSSVLSWYLIGPALRYYSNRDIVLTDGSQDLEKATLAQGLLTSSEEEAIESFSSLCENDCYVFVTEEMLYHISSIARSGGKEYFGGRIISSPCRDFAQGVVCGNGYIITKDSVTKRGVSPAVALMVRDGEKVKTVYGQNGPGFVLYEVGEKTYSFEIDPQYIDSILVGFFLQDSPFELVGKVAEPRQVFVYKVE